MSNLNQHNPEWLTHLVGIRFKRFKRVTLDEFDQAIQSSSAIYVGVNKYAGWLFIQVATTTTFIMPEPQYNQQVLKRTLHLVTSSEH